MFGKVMLTAALIVASASASAKCSIDSFTVSETVRKARQLHGPDWHLKNFDALCKKLNRANAALMILGDATVLVDRSIGWAVVGLSDRDSDTVSMGDSAMSTQVNPYASQDKANELLYQAINTAADQLYDRIDSALAGLEEARKNTRNKYLKNK